MFGLLDLRVWRLYHDHTDSIVTVAAALMVEWIEGEAPVIGGGLNKLMDRCQFHLEKEEAHHNTGHIGAVYNILAL